MKEKKKREKNVGAFEKGGIKKEIGRVREGKSERKKGREWEIENCRGREG